MNAGVNRGERGLPRLFPATEMTGETLPGMEARYRMHKVPEKIWSVIVRNGRKPLIHIGIEDVNKC